jgi:asparagine synthase (glutamine-hydrolysing)
VCGICGHIRFDGAPADTAMVLRMRDMLGHRGPDDQGLWSEGFERGAVALGHTRLSILDLSAAGHQPMIDPTGRYVITYNGEVYNYLEVRADLEKKGFSFVTRTDTEVILAAYTAYGERCLELFNGMFAFAIWDRKTALLFCARDRLGVKPFYYALGEQGFVFASEIKALTKAAGVAADPNADRIYDYLTFCLLDHSADTFFRHIKQLPPGHFCVCSAAGMRAQRYWELSRGQQHNDGEVVEQFRSLFFDSVKLRLRSDVPVGVLLSGGLDSSAIACAAAQGGGGQKPVTFSSTLGGGGIDETAFSDSVARFIGAQNVKLFPASGRFWDELDDMLYAQDEPTHAADIYANWCMMREVHGQGIKVLLNGQGGDELFAGYGWYVKNFLVSLLLRGQIGAAVSQMRALRRRFESSMTTGYVPLVANIAEALLPPSVKRLFKEELSGMRRIGRSVFCRANQSRDADNIRLVNASRLEDKLRNDLLIFTVPHYLHYEDRNSMHFSIEERLPFLEYRLVEWANNLDVRWKIHNGATKYVMRQALSGKLPAEVLDRKDKKGLSIPIENWLRTDLLPQFSRFFQEDCYIYSNIVERKAFLKEFDAFAANRPTPIRRMVWRLFSLEKWYRLHVRAT